jgi:hypothetical protein
MSCRHTSGWHTVHNLVLIFAEHELRVQGNQLCLKYLYVNVPKAFNFKVITAVTMKNTILGYYAAYSDRS